MIYEFPIKEITGLLYHAQKYGYKPYLRYYETFFYDNNDELFFSDLLNTMRNWEFGFSQNFTIHIPLLIEDSKFVYSERSYKGSQKRKFYRLVNEYLEEIAKNMYMFNEEIFDMLFNNCTFVIDSNKWEKFMSVNTKDSVVNLKNKLQIMFLKK